MGVACRIVVFHVGVAGRMLPGGMQLRVSPSEAGVMISCARGAPGAGCLGFGRFMVLAP